MVHTRSVEEFRARLRELITDRGGSSEGRRTKVDIDRLHTGDGWKEALEALYASRHTVALLEVLPIGDQPHLGPPDTTIAVSSPPHVTAGRPPTPPPAPPAPLPGGGVAGRVPKGSAARPHCCCRIRPYAPRRYGPAPAVGRGASMRPLEVDHRGRRSHGFTVAVVGTGLWGRRLIPLFKVHPLVDDIALCDLDADKLAAASRDFEIARIPSLDAVLESDVDAVALVTQHWLHAGPGQAGARSGQARVLVGPRRHHRR